MLEKTDGFILLIFLLLYVSATIMFSFVICAVCAKCKHIIFTHTLELLSKSPNFAIVEQIWA